MDGVILTKLNQIIHPKGDIYHAMKSSDIGYHGFGEAYFSNINQGEIKGWKQHSSMILNLVVVIGEVQFVIYDGEDFFEVNLSIKNYKRLTISPGLWVAFKGIGETNMLLNLANTEHDPKESSNLTLSKIKYSW